MISYAIFIHSGKFQRLLNDSTKFQNLLKASIGMEKKILEGSRLFWYFLDEVIILEKFYNQINTLFTTTYLPSISPISGSIRN